MGTVVYLSCWQKKSASSLSVRQQLQQLQVSEAQKIEEIALLDACFYTESKKNRDCVQQALEYGNVMIMLVGSKFSGYSLHHSEAVMRQQTFKITPLEGLCTSILSSKEVQWMRKPVHYGALYLELTLRAQDIEQKLFLLNDPNSS